MAIAAGVPVGATHAGLPDRGWNARLSLRFERAGARTRLAMREHHGPLVLQKPLYPEGEGVCQCIIVHPPGGVAGGDRLELQGVVGTGAHVQLTTPGAAKWYRAAGRSAAQVVDIKVANEAILEWCPQGTIVFDGAEATSHLRIALHGDARYIGWDTVCLGRTASGERFTRGHWRQRIDIKRDDALVWSERAVLAGNSRTLSSPAGLNGEPVFGTFVAMPIARDPELLMLCRAIVPLHGEGVVTWIDEALIGRFRGGSTEAGQAYFAALWSALRPRMTGRLAVPPRIWRT